MQVRTKQFTAVSAGCSLLYYSLYSRFTPFFVSPPSRDSSCEAGESEVNESQEERSVPPLSKQKTTSSSTVGKRKRLRKKKGVGLRKKLRTHIESVEEFNPEARNAQTAELDRIRRLELQRRISSTHDDRVDVEASNEPVEAIAESASVFVGEKRRNSSSPEVIKVEARDVPRAAGASKKTPVEPIVIDSGSSDSDTNYQRPPLPRAPPPPASSRVGGPSHTPRRTGQALREPLRGKYDVFAPRPDGRVLVNEGHAPSEEDVFLAPQVARVAKPHQVCVC